MRGFSSRVSVAALLGLLIAGCGDDGGAPADGGPGGGDGGPSTRLASGVPARYEGAAVRLDYGIATDLGATVFEVDAQGPFAIVLSDQPIDCRTNLAARPASGLYVVVYVPEAVGTTSPVTVTMVSQTSGPRMSKTFDSGSADVLQIARGLVDATVDAMLDDGAVSSVFGAVVVPRCGG